MRLTPHFTLDELTISETAARRGWDNIPPPDAMAALRHTALGLEGIRTLLGAPIIVTSGYRSPELNSAIGGSASSQHMRGEAADFICPGYGDPRNVVHRIVDSGLDYDQVIVEFERWVHVSFVRGGGRRHALVVDRSGTRPLLA
jgi:hypothetical protein